MRYRETTPADDWEYLRIVLKTAVIVAQRQIDAQLEQLAWDWYRGALRPERTGYDKGI